MQLKENEDQLISPVTEAFGIDVQNRVWFKNPYGGRRQGLCGIKLHSLDPLSLDAGKEFTENIHRAPFGFYFPLRADGGHGQTS